MPPLPSRPQRQNIKIIDSDEVQGAGSWVKFKLMSVSERNEYRQLIQASQDLAKENEVSPDRIAANEAALRACMCKFIIGWNWVDDEGNDLPQPQNNPSVIDQLNQLEIELLMGIMLSDGVSAKKNGTLTSQ